MRIPARFQEIPDDFPPRGNNRPRGYLGYRRQAEPAEREAGMGDDEVGLLHDHLPDQHDINVQLPRSPFAPWYPPRGGLHFLHEGQQFIGRKEAFAAGRQVQEPRLVRLSPRLPRVDSGDPTHFHLPGKTVQTFPQLPRTIPDVASQEKDHLVRRQGT